MTSFTFSIEQVRAAPPKVRRWIKGEVMTSIAALNGSEHALAQVHEAALAACMPEEASQLFDVINGYFLYRRSSSELARHTSWFHRALFR